MRMATCDPVADGKGKAMSRLLAGPPSAWLLRLVLLIAATAAYWPSFRGVFVFDNYGHIVNNQRLQSFSAFLPELAWNPRPIVYLTLWLNYQIGGLNVPRVPPLQLRRPLRGRLGLVLPGPGHAEAASHGQALGRRGGIRRSTLVADPPAANASGHLHHPAANR